MDLDFKFSFFHFMGVCVLRLLCIDLGRTVTYEFGCDVKYV